jgi:hypothetical protein
MAKVMPTSQHQSRKLNIQLLLAKSVVLFTMMLPQDGDHQLPITNYQMASSK